jgi:RimJ/RimL family protein N-acetyltransferase
MNGRALLEAVKATAGGRPQLCVSIGAPVRALLRPVATQRPDREDVARLTEWRNRNVRSFLTEFVADAARTERWLKEIVGPRPDKILFMVDDLDGRTFGYMGLDFIDWEAKSGEADAIVRGEAGVPGGMTAGLTTLLAWARNQLGLVRLGVRVLSDNPALEFYRKLGFVERRRVPLRRHEEPDGVAWLEDPEAQSGRFLVHMELA